MFRRITAICLILVGVSGVQCVNNIPPPAPESSCFSHLQHESGLCRSELDSHGCRTRAMAQFEICRDTHERRFVVMPLAADTVRK